MAQRCLLFRVDPDRIFEHPPELPVNKAEFKETFTLTGWAVVGPNFDGPPEAIINVYNPTVVVEEIGVYIKIGNSHFWYESAGSTHRPNRNCWFQSGSTLRFIKQLPKAT